MNRRWKALLLAVTGALTPALVNARAEAPPEAKPGQPQPQIEANAADGPSNTLGIHGSITNTLTSHYVTRGVLLEDQGIIYQNTDELYFTLAEEPKIVGIVGIFNSVHDEQTGAGSVSGATADSTVSQWFEFDWWAGASFDLTKELNATLLYQEFHSPNDAFTVCKNVQLKLAYNDTDLWGGGGFALKPYVIVFSELDGKAGSGTDEGTYFEVGVNPSFVLDKDGKYPVTLGVPLTVGLGISDFYEDDDFFGFASVGVTASVPMAFVPDQYGAWTLSSGVYYYYYGEGVDDFNAGIGNGDDYDVVATVGVDLAF